MNSPQQRRKEQHRKEHERLHHLATTGDTKAALDEVERTKDAERIARIKKPVDDGAKKVAERYPDGVPWLDKD